MTESGVLWWLFLLPAACGVIDFVLGKRNPQMAGLPTIIGAVGTIAIAAKIVVLVHEGTPLSAWGGELYADGLSAVVIIIVCLVGLVSSLFAWPYLRHEMKIGKVA